jgi:hypothetical protein
MAFVARLAVAPVVMLVDRGGVAASHTRYA